MKQPRYLKPGDTIGIVVPARKLDNSCIDSATKLLNSWGYKVKLGKYVNVNEHAYFSATDVHRRADFQEMLDDENIHTILCARGGYGSTRIIDELDFTHFLEKPKWIIGFSDITAFHLQLYSLGICSIHATMPVLFSKGNASQAVESLRNTLIGNRTSLTATPDVFNRPGRGIGNLVGGNLSLINDMLCTQSELDTNGTILVLEDVDEYFYKVDRMLVQLKRAGKLSKLSGLIIGHFTDIKDPSSLPFGETVKEMVIRHTKEYSYPIAFNFPIGHEEPNLAWVHGAQAKLEVTSEQVKLGYTKEEINE